MIIINKVVLIGRLTKDPELKMTPDIAVMTEEGTYNHGTGRFYCTDCYITAGMPLGKA